MSERETVVELPSGGLQSRQVLHAGGKFGGEDSGYTVSGGLHGVGISVVNALSESLEVTVWRGGLQFQQSFARGLPTSQLESSPALAEDATRKGTRVRFLPDSQIFPKIHMAQETYVARLRELAFLNSGATVHLQGPVEKKGEAPPPQVFHYEGGLVEYVQHMNKDNEMLHHEPISLIRDVEVDGSRIHVEVALQWSANTYSDTVLGYANRCASVRDASTQPKAPAPTPAPAPESAPGPHDVTALGVCWCSHRLGAVSGRSTGGRTSMG
jgi:DNA gyrase subunit B